MIIAKDALLQVVFQCVSDALRRLEVHIRHPHCLKVCTAELFLQAVPLVAIRIPAVYEAESLSTAVDTHMIAPFFFIGPPRLKSIMQALYTSIINRSPELVNDLAH